MDLQNWNLSDILGYIGTFQLYWLLKDSLKKQSHFVLTQKNLVFFRVDPTFNIFTENISLTVTM